ncbi:MAG: hypothetical protein KatS3mg105_3903 [Gemmatales bacterium]|nr:MAG: hypothetical protein KatS3mg105_3903 [Gemmatales bacterium]
MWRPANGPKKQARRRGEAAFHLTLLARNRTGFKNLIKMASAAFLDGYYYVPRIDKELLEQHSEGIICLSGCASSEFSEFILKDQLDEARQLAEWYLRLFGRNFYIEIQNKRPGHPETVRRGGHRDRRQTRRTVGGDVRRSLFDASRQRCP